MLKCTCCIVLVLCLRPSPLPPRFFRLWTSLFPICNRYGTAGGLPITNYVEKKWFLWIKRCFIASSGVFRHSLAGRRSLRGVVEVFQRQIRPGNRYRAWQRQNIAGCSCLSQPPTPICWICLSLSTAYRVPCRRCYTLSSTTRRHRVVPSNMGLRCG